MQNPSGPAPSVDGANRIPEGRKWLRLYDVSAAHPWMGGAAGIGLVTALVPILTLAGGYRGAVGPSIPLFFLVPMLVASTLGGRVPGVMVSVAAVAVWDWFFIPPLHTATIYYPRDVLALVVFFADALLTGQLATIARRRAEDAIQRARTSEALYDLSVALIGSHDLAAVLPILAQRLRETFALEACAILLRAPEGMVWRTAAASGTLPHDLDIAESRNIAGILSWVGNTGEMCALNDGLSSGRVNPHPATAGRQAQFWPLRVGTRLVGVLEMVYKLGAVVNAEQDRLLTTLVNGAAIALEQERLMREEQDAVLARESDLLKSALLSSVSHDLRTPLAGIKAAASSLLQDDVQWSDEDRRAFATDIDAEADRLTRLVSNLLDLSRIEAGAIQPGQEWEDFGELVERVARRLQPRLVPHTLELSIPASLPPVRVDAVHLEQALTNLIENAAKYSPPTAPILVNLRMTAPSDDHQELLLSVRDQGPGIAPGELDKIFGKFYRIAGSRAPAGGTGMGLAIVKGLIDANGGRVEVTSEVGRGSTFTIALPVDKDALEENHLHENERESPFGVRL